MSSHFFCPNQLIFTIFCISTLFSIKIVWRETDEKWLIHVHFHWSTSLNIHLFKMNSCWMKWWMIGVILFQSSYSVPLIGYTPLSLTDKWMAKLDDTPRRHPKASIHCLQYTMNTCESRVSSTKMHPSSSPNHRAVCEESVRARHSFAAFSSPPSSSWFPSLK